MSLSVQNLNYTYNPGTPFETKALDNVSVTINDGEFVGIIGHTGSGKSTFVQHLNALIKPDSGKVLIDGEDIFEAKNKAALRLKVGLVFQYPEYQLFEETVLKDVCFGPLNKGFDANEALQSAKNALNTVGIGTELWEKSPFELSGGQKRRVAIAGVLAMKPEMLILDEPAAGLDPRGRNEIFNIISDIHSKGTTVIMVSHSMDDVARLCSRLIVFKSGRVLLDGKPEEVFSNAEILEKSGLMPPRAAILKDRLNAKGFGLDDNIYTLEALTEALAAKLSKEEHIAR